MRRDDRFGIAVLRLMVELLSVLVLMDTPARASDLLLLEVIVNNYPTGKIGEFTLRDGALFASPGELRELGIRVPDSVRRTMTSLSHCQLCPASPLASIRQPKRCTLPRQPADCFRPWWARQPRSITASRSKAARA